MQTVDSSVTLFCIESLKEKSEYEFRVFAENPIGMSEEAAVTEYIQLKTHASKSKAYTLSFYQLDYTFLKHILVR